MDSPTPQNAPAPAPANGSNRRWLIPVLLVVAVGVVALAVALWRWMAPPPAAPSTRPIDLPVSAEPVDSMDDIAALTTGKDVPPVFEGVALPAFRDTDHVYGDQAAPYSVVEYSNFGNRYADLLHPYLKDLVDADPTVNWVARHYPMTVNDYMPAQAAECAYFGGGHAAFWAFYDAVFPKPSYSLDALTATAGSQGLDQQEFRDCMDKNYTRDRVLGDTQDAQIDAKVTISPSYLVTNNVTGEVRLVEGVNTIDYIRQVLDAVR